MQQNVSSLKMKELSFLEIVPINLSNANYRDHSEKYNTVCDIGRVIVNSVGAEYYARLCRYKHNYLKGARFDSPTQTERISVY